MLDNIFAHDQLDAYKCDANEALSFKLVRGKGDETTFKPAMTHQIFGEAESIFGYEGLEVSVCLSACSLHTCILVDYKRKITPALSNGIEADDIVALLGDKMLDSYSTDEKSFARHIGPTDHEFKPFGSLINSYSVPDPETGKERYFETYHVETLTEDFKRWHDRMQVLLLFFIDAVSYIDVTDPKWHYFTLHEKLEGGEGRAFVGYMSVYNCYAYPDLIRPRVSQALVLPPWQGCRHGTRLLQSFYHWTLQQDNVLDIAVEDPNSEFQRIRDLVDFENSSKLFSSQPGELSSQFIVQIRKKLKLSKKQAQRVYEMMRLREVGGSEEAMKVFKSMVKRRLNIPLQKNSRHFERLSTRLSSNELSAAMNHHSTQQRLQLLDQDYQLLLEQYQQVLEKVEEEAV